MQDRDTILTINVVEPGLIRAVKLHSDKMGKQLKGLALVHSGYVDQPGRPKDTSGLFTEVVCDFDNPDEIQKALKPYEQRILAATCRYEEAIQPFSQVIPFLPYIYTPSETVLEWSTEKPLMRDRLRAYDPDLVPKYQYMEAKDLPRLSELVKDFTYPVIVKPSGLSKALLVTRCENEAELRKRLEHTFVVIEKVYERDQYPGKPSVLVEEMMQGQMYSVDAYVTHDGEIFCLPIVKVVTAHSVGLPGFYGHERQLPVTELSEQEIEGAFEASRSAVRALNLSATTAHIELYHTPTGWKIIEIAARMGGYRDALYREVYGTEHFYNDLAIRMGHKPVMPNKPKAHAVVINLYPEQEGDLVAIDGLGQASKIESVCYLAAHAEIGDRTLFAINGGDPVVDGILSNEDPEKLRADVEKVRELVRIKTTPVDLSETY